MDSFGSASSRAAGAAIPLRLTRGELRRRLRPARLAWVVLGLAAASFVLAALLEFRAPHLGFTVGPSGLIRSVETSSAAYAAGVRPGDLLYEINGISSVEGRPPFEEVSAGSPALLQIRGGSTDRGLLIEPRSRLEARLDSLTGTDGAALTRSLASLLRVAVNAGMLVMAGLILFHRPEPREARLAALTLACWVGGNGIGSIPGARAFFADVPRWVELTTHALDLTFLCAFFGAALHFALLFPVPFPIVRRHPALQAAAWLATAPLAAVAVGTLLSLSTGLPALTRGQQIFHFWGATLLAVHLSVLLLHVNTSLDVNDRRRIRLVLAAMLPGFITWVISITVEAIGASEWIHASAYLLRWVGAAAGAAVFAYALTRERLFEFKPFLRLSLKYVLARGTLIVVLAVPAILLAGFLWSNRHETLAGLVSRNLIVLCSLMIGIILLIRFRRALLDRLDRRFFRESWQAHHSLLRIASALQHASDPEVVGRIAVTEIERTLHPGAVAWYRRQHDQFTLACSVGPAPPALPATGHLQAVLLASTGARSVSSTSGSTLRARLSEEERLWLDDAGFILAIPVRADESLAGAIFLSERITEEPYGRDDIGVMNALASQLALTESYAGLEQIARRDALTDALNRHSFDSIIRARGSSGLDHGCVAVIDIDDLKQLNDTFGHAAGDRAIRRVAVTLRTRLSSDDLLFRWGGDEFVILFFGRDRAECEPRLLEAEQILGSHSGPPVQVSTGVADFENIPHVAEALEVADRRMYERKQAARSRARGGTRQDLSIL